MFTASALRALFISLENAQEILIKCGIFAPTVYCFLPQLRFLVVGLLVHAALLCVPYQYRLGLFRIARS